MLRLFLTGIILLSIGSLSGQNVTIRGLSADYAGKELIFYHFPEPVSRHLQKLAGTKIGRDGSFQISFSVSQTTEVYTDLEKFKGTIVVEPGKEYNISLPPFSPRTSVEAASPYFKPELFWLGLKGVKTTDTNFLVRAFLTEYNNEVASHTNDIYQKRSADTVKAIISRLEKNNPAGNSSYLKILKTYSYGELELAITEPAKETVIEKYFANGDVFFAHPAYQQLFNSIFSDYLVFRSLDIRHSEEILPGKQGNFKGWVNQLKKEGLKQPVAELVAAKCFYDGYYSNKSDKSLMLKGLKEAASQATFNPLQESLPGIIKGITSLQEGNQAPALKLIDQKEVASQLRTNGKYLYLIFFRSDSKDSRAELDSLLSLEKKLKTILTVVPVSLDKNFAGSVKIWNDKKYPWQLYRPANIEQAESDFLLRTVPVFYLISPDHKLVLSPALSPSHNFETLFLKIYRDNHFKQKK